jgi:hypothetical protein
MTMTLTKLFTASWRAASLPPALAHELTHFVFALPWASTTALVFEDGHAGLHVDWHDDAPGWGVALAAYGPFIVGMVIGLVGLGSLLSGEAPALESWPAIGALSIWWAIYVWPSPDDRRTARNHASHETADD